MPNVERWGAALPGEFFINSSTQLRPKTSPFFVSDLSVLFLGAAASVQRALRAMSTKSITGARFGITDILENIPYFLC